jgi:quercetin dioxygenase-like cupin family protein
MSTPTPSQERVFGSRGALTRRGALQTLGVATSAAMLLAPRGAQAQEATPSGGMAATPAGGAIVAAPLAPGVTAEVFAGAPSDRAPGQTVYLARFVFEPGAEIFPHSHPGTTILGVAEGSFGWTLLQGTAHVVRGSASGSPTGTEDLTDANTDVVLEPGDAIFYEDDVVHTARGAGDTAAVVLGTLVLTAGEPLLMPVMDMGTPEGTPTS